MHEIAAVMIFLGNINSNIYGSNKCYYEDASWVNKHFMKDTVDKNITENSLVMKIKEI